MSAPIEDDIALETGDSSSPKRSSRKLIVQPSVKAGQHKPGKNKEPVNGVIHNWEPINDGKKECFNNSKVATIVEEDGLEAKDNNSLETGALPVDGSSK